jgi:hypothetical protein
MDPRKYALIKEQSQKLAEEPQPASEEPTA